MAGLSVPVDGQSAESSATPPSPPDFVAGGLVAGLQRGGGGGERVEDFVVVPAEKGQPPADGPFFEGFDRLDASETDNTATGLDDEPEPAPVARDRGSPIPWGPVFDELEPAPEGFGGLAPCAGGYVCGAAQVLPRPYGLTCWATSTDIALSWNSVAGADDYTARLQLAVAGERQIAKTTESTWVVFSGLSPSTRYFVGVNSNSGNQANYYSGVYCTTGVGSPDCGVVSASGIKLFWRADGRVHRWYVARATIAGEYVEGRSLDGSLLSTVFSGLEEEVSYKFYFWWQDSPDGAWNQVHPSTVCTTMAPPPAPSVTCTTAVSSVRVTWAMLEEAAKYRVSRGNGWVSTMGLSHEFLNLDPATEYSVRVQGNNSAGWSDDGKVDCTTTSTNLPSPTGLSCSATSTAINITWHLDERAHSYLATAYSVESGHPQTVQYPNPKSATFADLTPSTKYWIAVQAVEYGNPQQSTGVYCTTLLDIPSPSVTCVAKSSSIHVYWKKVDGVLKYRAMLDVDVWTPDIEGTDYKFESLTPGTLYYITVQSGDLTGWGRGSVVECLTTAAGVVCEAVSDSSLTLEWEIKSEVDYWYAARVDGGYVDGRMIRGQHSTEFAGLSRSKRYVLLLWWYENDEWNAVDPAPECYTKLLATPTIEGSHSGGNTLTILYGPVEDADYYEASIVPSEQSDELEESWPDRPPGPFGPYDFGDWEIVFPNPSNRYTFIGLTPGIRYSVTLRARLLDVNPWIWEATVPDVVQPVINCTAGSATSIAVSWDDPDGAYHWKIMLVANWNLLTESKVFAEGRETSAEFTGLQPNTRYWVAAWRRSEISSQWQFYLPIPYCHTTPKG